MNRKYFCGEKGTSTRSIVLGVMGLLLLLGILPVEISEKVNISGNEASHSDTRICGCRGNNTNVSMMSAYIMSSSVTPPTGGPGTVFCFRMKYAEANGTLPSRVWAVVDDTAHFEMKALPPVENISEGINYSVNISGKNMLLGGGNHTYYPAVFLNDELYYGQENFTQIFVVEIGEGKDGGSSGKGSNWYDNSCCFIPFLILLVLLALSLINNLIFRYQRKRQMYKNRDRTGAGRQDRFAGPGSTALCPKCQRPKMGDYNFCPGCGEEFNITRTWKDDVASELDSNNRTMEKQKRNKKTKFSLGRHTFICSICGARVKEGRTKCPNCGVELE